MCESRNKQEGELWVAHLLCLGKLIIAHQVRNGGHFASMINMDNTLKKWNRMTDAARERQLTRMVVQSEITYMPQV